MKNMEKYFLAILPSEEIFNRAEQIKNELKEKFNVKYALKSPAHITVKMPFPFDENREAQLIEKLGSFLKSYPCFDLRISGIHHFGNRVIYSKVAESEALRTLQEGLRKFCRLHLHLVEELSDRNYTPHITLAFKDIKPKIYDQVFEFVNKQPIEGAFSVHQICLLKKIEGRWKVIFHLDLQRKS